MALRLRWQGWLVLVTALLLFSGCASSSGKTTIEGTKATTGPVIVTTDMATYPSGQAIGVIVTNGSSTNYYSHDGKSGCSVVQLERYDSGARKWIAMDPCVAVQSVQTLMIASSTVVPYTLAPNSPTDANSWQTGQYRVSVQYSTATDGSTNAQEAHSAAFTIHN